MILFPKQVISRLGHCVELERAMDRALVACPDYLPPHQRMAGKANIHTTGGARVGKGRKAGKAKANTKNKSAGDDDEGPSTKRAMAPSSRPAVVSEWRNYRRPLELNVLNCIRDSELTSVHLLNTNMETAEVKN